MKTLLLPASRPGTHSYHFCSPAFLSAGVGIHPEGLRALFKDYVQGTEDEMRKPRSRGGTGLGLSICSKQVSSLGVSLVPWGRHSVLSGGASLMVNFCAFRYSVFGGGTPA